MLALYYSGQATMQNGLVAFAEYYKMIIHNAAVLIVAVLIVASLVANITMLMRVGL